MLVGSVTRAFDRFALLGQNRGSREIVAKTGLLDGVAVQIGYVLGDAAALGVVPRPCADTVAGVDGRLTVGRGDAEVSVPCLRAAGGCCQLLADGIRTGQAAEVCAIAGAGAGHEE